MSCKRRLQLSLESLPRIALLILALCLSSAASAEISQDELSILTARCTYCHGENGVSQSPLWPSLAGLDASYLLSQMRDFRKWPDSNRRSSTAPQMAFILRPLSEDQLSALATYYSELDDQWPTESITKQQTSNKDLGRQLYEVGDSKVGIPACSSCHGANGQGHAIPGAPRIAGQYSHYSANQLRAYRNGTRTDTARLMASAAARLSDEQISAVAAYIHELGAGNE